MPRQKGTKSNKKKESAELSVQEKFVAKIKVHVVEQAKQGKVVPFSHRPSEILVTGNEKSLDATKWYNHEVLVCAPHWNFPKEDINCENCPGHYQPKQWHEDRV